MSGRDPSPGITRDARITAEGLQRLEAQLARGARLSDMVLRQWLKRYGTEARKLMQAYGCYRPELER
jgi:hypothetical protein